MKSRKPTAIIAEIVKYVILVAGALFTLLPFVWMILSSLKSGSEIVSIPPTIIPTHFMFSNYAEAWQAAPFPRYFLNTVFVATVTTVGVLLTSILAAFAFARLDFPGKKIVFSLFMATLMIPGEMLLITNFVTVTKLKWVDTYKAMIVPWLANVFYTYLLSQFFSSVPEALYLAAKVDKCSDLKFLFKIMVPMNKNAITTVAILSFIGSWNSFLWPLLVTNSPNMRVLSHGLVRFQSEAGAQYQLIMAASCILVVPIVIIYLFLRKYILEGMAYTGVKG